MDAEPDARQLSYRLRSSSHSATPQSYDLVDYASHLQAVLSIIETLAPLPRSAALRVEPITDPKQSAFAPLLSLAEADANSPLVPPAVQGLWGTHRSRNIFWLYSVLNRGLPITLPCRYAHTRIKKAWLKSDEAKALHKIIAMFGAQPLLNAHPPGPDADFVWQWKDRDRFQWPKLQEKARSMLIKRLSQAQVFSMNYPSSRRCWGPFLPVDAPKGSSARVPTHSAGDDEDEDGDYIPPAARRHAEPPTDDLLYPDWVHLAAVRIVVENCLRSDVVYHDIWASLTNAHGLRPGFWVPDFEEGAEVHEAGSLKSYERDWAGVEGTWQSVIFLP